MKVFDQTQAASAQNARTYREFLRSAEEAAFIRSERKRAFIVSVVSDYGECRRKLIVCVGPFDGWDAPDLNRMLPKLRGLRYNDVQVFARARVEPLPHHAQIVN